MRETDGSVSPQYCLTLFGGRTLIVKFWCLHFFLFARAVHMNGLWEPPNVAHTETKAVAERIVISDTRNEQTYESDLLMIMVMMIIFGELNGWSQITCSC